ncbi:MAG: TAXI family TRAP transporter solute-binding subunit [Dehalococcoidales bacterium]|nr:TAXI family TRAP transporter solute-binding subunit [Dehalococcoidales bacterium]
MDVKQVGYEQVGSSLKSGVFDVAIVADQSAGRYANPWTRELILTTPVNVVNPSAAEQKTLGAVKGLTPTTFPATRLFEKKDVGVSDVWAFSGYQGWNFPAYGTIDVVYAFTKAWYEHTDELVKIEAGFQQFSEEGLKFNAQIIESMPDVPTHPGVAKYYKEKGIWKDNWKIGTVETKNW